MSWKTEWYKSVLHKRIKKKICLKEVPEGGEVEKGPEKIFEEIVTENFPNVQKETVPKPRKCKNYHTGSTQGGTCPYT